MAERKATVALPAGRTAPGIARRFAADRLDRWGLGDLAEIATLLVSELVTNAVLHGRGDRRLDLEATPDGVRFAVHDDGEGRPRRRHPGADEFSGRGLAIVEALATRWGVEPHPGSGKIVWFELDTAPESVPR